MMVISLTTGKKVVKREKKTMMMKSLIKVRQYSKTLPCLEGSLTTNFYHQNSLMLKLMKKRTKRMNLKVMKKKRERRTVTSTMMKR